MAVARRRLPSTPAGRRVRAQWALSITVGLAIVGFVGAAQWNSSPVRQQFTTSAQQVLARQVTDLESEQKALREQQAAADAQIQQMQGPAAGSQTALKQLNSRLATARLQAGLVRVKGPGAVVEIADSQRVVPPNSNPSNYIVLVDDLRDIVTALWASGAEAISINGERLVSTSSIYGVGSSVLVNTSFLSPPFRVQAIGSRGLLDRFLANPAYLGRVAQRITSYGLEFATSSDPAVDSPAVVGNTRFRWAVPTQSVTP